MDEGMPKGGLCTYEYARETEIPSHVQRKLFCMRLGVLGIYCGRTHMVMDRQVHRVRLLHIQGEQQVFHE